MKVLVIGGMHGNEMLGIDLVRSLLDSPLGNIDAVIANERALIANTRFVDVDLNRSFPGSSRSNIFEQKRAAELLRLCEQYDVVLDFHNTWCPDNDCSFVGEKADDSLLKVSEFLGLKRVIIADYECINKYAKNCLSIEVSVQSKLNDVAVWREKIARLTAQDQLGEQADVTKFRFVYRMTLEDRDRLKLEAQNLRAFEPIDAKLAEAMGVHSPAYPIFIADKFTPYNYGGLLNLIE